MRLPDPFAAFRFVVEINGTQEAGFSEAAGFEAETEVEDRNEGGINEYVHRLAKHTKYPNLSLKRGITLDGDLWEWHQRVVSGMVERRTIAVILRGPQGQELWRWVFDDAWPVKWSGSGLNATNSQVFVESVEFAHQGMRRVAV